MKQAGENSILLISGIINIAESCHRYSYRWQKSAVVLLQIVRLALVNVLQIPASL